MIVLFGSRAGHLKTLRLTENCSNCKANDCLELIVYQRFAHIFWIPIFPLRKIFTAQCYKCKHNFAESDVKTIYPLVYNDAKKKARSPLWSFTGPVVVISLTLLFGVLIYINEVRRQFMIYTPKSGDIYKYKTNDGQYSLLKVSESIGDTVYVFTNNFATNNVISMTKLLRHGRTSFSNKATPKLKSDLITMYENGVIMNIERE